MTPDGGPFSGKVALITGAANGIGRACVERFVAGGASVIAVDRCAPVGVQDDPRVRWVEADVTDAAAMAAASGLFGGLDICVANAGVGQIEDFLAGSRESWSKVFDVNLIGVMITLQAAARVMVDQGSGGRLLATASIAGLRGEAGTPSPAYAASKGAVMALTRELAQEFASHRITVNAVAPGQVDTDLNNRDHEEISRRAGRDAAQLRSEQLATSVPLGRMGVPGEVASLFAYLASDDASFITGSTFRIDGGELAI